MAFNPGHLPARRAHDQRHDAGCSPCPWCCPRSNSRRDRSRCLGRGWSSRGCCPIPLGATSTHPTARRPCKALTRLRRRLSTPGGRGRWPTTTETFGYQTRRHGSRREILVSTISVASTEQGVWGRENDRRFFTSARVFARRHGGAARWGVFEPLRGCGIWGGHAFIMDLDRVHQVSQDRLHDHVGTGSEACTDSIGSSRVTVAHG